MNCWPKSLVYSGTTQLSHTARIIVAVHCYRTTVVSGAIERFSALFQERTTGLFERDGPRSEHENWQNERYSNSDPWIKIEWRVNLEKKSECPALGTGTYPLQQIPVSDSYDSTFIIHLRI